MFKFAIDCHKLAHNIAGEGMAWGNLGTVYRALGRYDDAIQCHQNYRDNAEKRLDIGGVAIMRTQIALDYLFKNDLVAAEEAILQAFRTLETIRRQLGDDDQAKISNFEKNQSEAYNTLQVILIAQGKYKEGLVLSEISRARALAELVKNKLEGKGQSAGVGANSAQELSINKDFIDATYENILAVCRKLDTVLVLYSLVKEPNPRDDPLRWVYVWVVHPSGAIHFTKTQLECDIQTKVEVNEDFVIDLGRSLSQGPDLEQFLSRLSFDEEQLKLRDAAHAPCVVKTLHDSDDLQLLHGLEESVFQRPDSVIGQLDMKRPLGLSVSGQISLPQTNNDVEVLHSEISSEEFPKKLSSSNCSNTSQVKHTAIVEIEENVGNFGKSLHPDEEYGATMTDETIAVSHVSDAMNKAQNNKVVHPPEERLSVESGIKTSTCLIPQNSEAMASGGEFNEKEQQEEHNKGPQKECTPEGPSLEGTKVKAPPELLDKSSTPSEVPNNKAPTLNTGSLGTEAVTSENMSTETEVKQESQSEAPQDKGDKTAQASQVLSEVDHWKTVLSQLNRVLIEPIKEYLPTAEPGGVGRVVFIPQDFLLKVSLVSYWYFYNSYLNPNITT